MPRGAPASWHSAESVFYVGTVPGENRLECPAEENHSGTEAPRARAGKQTLGTFGFEV
jgi:hypothetical protein